MSRALMRELSGKIPSTTILTVTILRNWPRERIERFAAHLLGDKCQRCLGVRPLRRGRKCSACDGSGRYQTGLTEGVIKCPYCKGTGNRTKGKRKG